MIYNSIDLCELSLILIIFKLIGMSFYELTNIHLQNIKQRSKRYLYFCLKIKGLNINKVYVVCLNNTVVLTSLLVSMKYSEMRLNIKELLKFNK